MSLCRSCNAPVLWAVTEASLQQADPEDTIIPKRIPLDPDPSPEGNVEIVGQDLVLGAPIARVHPNRPLFHAADLRLSHFVTCPNADQHRKTTK